MKVSRYLIALLVLGRSLASAQATPAPTPEGESVEVKPMPGPEQKAPPTPEAKAEASAHFRRGVELFQEEAFRAALVEFERAYAIAPDYRLIYNIAQARFETQDYIGAIQSYERYLIEGGDDITKERRGVVEAALAALRERVGTVNLVVNRKGAEVFVDDLSVGLTPIPPIRVNVGRHRISARSASGATDAEVVSVAGGDTVEVSLMLVEQVAQRDEQERPMPVLRKAAIGTWGAGGALLIGGLVTGLLAKSAQDDLDQLRNTPDVGRTKLQDEHDRVKLLAITTDVLIATGAVAAVTGTLLWVFGREEKAEEPKPKSARLHLDLGVGSVGVGGTF